MGRKKTQEEFKKEVFDLVGDEYEVLGEYVNTKTKILMKHNKCDNEYEVTPDHFLRGARCPKCYGNMKKTTGYFKKEVIDLVGKEYTVLGEYVGANKKVKIRHNKCGHVWGVNPTDFLCGSRCPKCFGTHKKSTEQFKEEVFDLVGEEYSVLGEYVNNHTKIIMKHNKCGFEYEVKPNNFLTGRRCIKCSGLMKKTTEQFKQEVYNLVGDEYTVLGEYKNAATKIKMKHNICNHEWEVVPYSFLSGNRCPKCAGKLKKTTDSFKKEVFDIVGNEYTVLGDYIDTKTKIKMKHNKCGNEWEVTPNHFLYSNSRCSKCFGGVKKSQEQFKEEIYNLVGDEYEFLEEYINSQTKIKIRHNVCGHEYEVAPNHFLHGNRCPKCKSSISKGERAIMKYLEKNKIPFSYEHKFEDLEDKIKLRFDFYLPERNICIEFDGRQHYEVVNFGGISQEKAEENFTVTQKHDKMKDEYCKEKGIKLLRIPYTEFKDIKKILKKEIDGYSRK